ncbi:uncharacterized protein LOC134244217 [Saccostrea cucullata]|uniref:uncharacterized protein LOC134244217 n=1 Tax=Saccostrea cuccullata TaxID=36930 RepID=UPI002ED2538B
MRNGVVKKRKKNERGNSSQERSGVKKSRSQSPKVMIQNCLQEIAVSITKNSKTVTTRKSKKVCIVQKTTRVKKELFPVNRKKSGKTVKDISHSSALKLQKKGTKASPAKKGVSEKKKHGIVKQNQSSTRSDQNKTTKNKKTSTDEKVLKSQKGASPLEKEDKVANKTQPRKLPVKPVIRIHQGLRNTSLKTFKAQQNGKKVKELTKNIPQKPFPCAFCQKRFKKASQIEKHIKDDHKCSRCDKVLDSKEAKQRHFYGFHATEVHKCVTCQKEYNYPFHLRKHFESRSHKDLIKCLIKEMKKLSRGTSSIRGKALKDGNSKPAICPSETSNHDLTAYDKTSQSRSRKKVKFMEMENTFFDENADLLELIHKIEYTSGESGIVRHFLYKDPELAEIQSCLKEESNSSTCYEEIEIVKEYSITSHCENFLEDAGHPLAISDSSRSSERRDSETSISSESSELSEMNHGWNDSYVSNNVTMEPVMYGKARLESNSNSAMSGWFSAAFDVIEQRNLDDDPTYSSYLGLLSNESGMQICSVSSTVDPLNRSTQEYTKTYQELSCISSAKDLGFMEKGPIGIFSSHEMENGNHLQNNHFRAGDFSLTNSNSYTWSKQDRSCLQPPGAVRQELLSNGNSLCPLSPSVYGGHQTMSWIHPRQTANDTLDAAQSLIMLSNPEQGISPEVDNRSTDNESTNKDVQMEWESICSEIQRDVQEYTE